MALLFTPLRRATVFNFVLAAFSSLRFVAKSDIPRAHQLLPGDQRP